MMVVSPEEFCRAMLDLVDKSQLQVATAVSPEAYEMKRRVLEFFVKSPPAREKFEAMLRQRIADPDLGKELSRGVCGQILSSWLSGSYHYAADGKLVLRALFPAGEGGMGPKDDGSMGE